VVGPRALAPCRLEGVRELGHLGDLEGSCRETEPPRRHLRRGQDGRRNLGAIEKRDPRDVGYGLLQQLNLLGGTNHPKVTGSAKETKTTGIALVASFAARIATIPASTMTLTL
jgi:hypothetical protein